MIVPMHMGAMHPFEQALTLLLAFGPFVLLGLVIVVRRRADERAEAEASTRPVAGAESDQDAR